ncbi:MAG: cobalt transporter CbiM [Acidobacteriota bacterium]|nr:cobalt transporter CbiM [Acidobacteriota bacterium]
MHIPDGYLSPSTCVTLYAGAAVGWYASLKRLKRVLLSRMVPLISVFAAFAFVVMMFNLPLPGGTTGHALGVTIAAIVLGPSGAVLAVSIALAIQALFFGDGGISTLGANCCNMAIVGSLVAYGTYRLIAAGTAISSKRRVAAAAIAGYLALNATALIAAIEFGIQPALFHTANGTPLYAPYPLGIAIPAMMIGHLTFAGLAEAVISAGLVAHLQVADPGLLRATSGIAARGDAASPSEQPATKSLRRLWLTVVFLMLLTPLGILAAGTAWGEWAPSEFARGGSVPQPTGPSHGLAVTAGMQRLSTLWTAPFPSYAPGFVKSPAFGYLLSAMFGVGFLLAASLLLQHYFKRRRSTGHSS